MVSDFASFTTLRLGFRPCSLQRLKERVSQRAATDMEGTHGQLGARLTDRLCSDNADSFTDIDRVPRARSRPVAGAQPLTDSQVSGSGAVV